MSRLVFALALVGVVPGHAFAQADMAEQEVACAEFLDMTPDDQMLAVSDAIAANEESAGAAAGDQQGGDQQPAPPAEAPEAGPEAADQLAGDQQLSEEMVASVVAACTNSPELMLGGAVEAATAN